MLTFALPLLTVSESNAHESWRAGARRAREQKQAVLVALGQCPLTPDSRPYTVTLTRVAPRELDLGDRLPGALAHVRDAVALWLYPERVVFAETKHGMVVNPGHADWEVTWRYAQRRGPVRYYGVEIAIVAKGIA